MTTNSDLTQVEKLRALGLKSPDATNNPYKNLFDMIEEAKDWTTFRSDVQGQTSWADFESYLQNDIGMTADEASRFRKRMETKYDTFAEFQNALDNFDTFAGWRGSFQWGTTIAGDTTDGEDVTSGVRVHGEDGLSYDNIQVPKGTVEIFGPRVEFSNTDAPIDASTDFSTTNLQVSNTTPAPGETVTISADVTNNSGYSTSHTAKLLEDSERVDSKTLKFDGGETKTVQFSRTYEEYISVEVQINDSGTITVVVTPPGLSP